MQDLPGDKERPPEIVDPREGVQQLARAAQRAEGAGVEVLEQARQQLVGEQAEEPRAIPRRPGGRAVGEGVALWPDAQGVRAQVLAGLAGLDVDDWVRFGRGGADGAEEGVSHCRPDPSRRGENGSVDLINLSCRIDSTGAARSN
jgi:hypothetical protein